MTITFADRYGRSRAALKAEVDKRSRAQLAMRGPEARQEQCKAMTCYGGRCRWQALPHIAFCGVHQDRQAHGVVA